MQSDPIEELFGMINHLKRMAGDGIRPLDMMIKAPSVKQEPHKLQLWEISEIK